jgi:hypothetical protein
VGKGVGHQGETPEYHVGAEETIREPDQQASEQRPSHELVVKWLRNPAHSLCPLKIFVE